MCQWEIKTLYFLLNQRGNTAELLFEYVYSGTEVVLKDNEGTEWNIFGEAVSGPRTGQFLKPAPAFMGFWFSIPAFYTTVIYGI